MIRYKLRALMGRMAQAENRSITITKVAEQTGIGRVTLSHMANREGYVTSTDKLELLCEYFDCGIADLVEFVPNPTGKNPAAQLPRKLKNPPKKK